MTPLLNLHLPDRGEGRSFFERSDLGHIDLPRAREGGFGGGFFACYTPNPEDDSWNEESALTVRDGGYEVSDATAARSDLRQKRSQTSWRRACSGCSPEAGSGSYGPPESSSLVSTAVSWQPYCTSRAPRTWDLTRARSKNSTRWASARWGSCGAGPTPTPTASLSGFLLLLTQGLA